MKKTVFTQDWSHLSTSSKFDHGFETSNSELSVCRRDAIGSPNNSVFVESLIEQLARMVERDPKKQRVFYNAICSKLFDLRLIDDSYRHEELSGLRGQYRQALSSILSSPNACAPLLETSRYFSEFEEQKWIASGGFGQVFKARHRLDQVEYAVKKIKVRYKDAALFRRTLAEVKTLARLNHANIVQYKAAWLEACGCETPSPAIVDGRSSDSDGIVFEGSSPEERSESSSDTDRQLAIFRPQPQFPLQVFLSGFTLLRIPIITLVVPSDHPSSMSTLKSSESLRSSLTEFIQKEAFYDYDEFFEDFRNPQ